MDLAALPGDQIRSPAGGRVSFAGWVVDRSVLTIVHSGGLRSSFEPVESELAVGETVAAGDVIGTLADSSHCAPAGCLHWGVRRGEDYVDPLQFVLDRRPSVLLPLEGPWLSGPDHNDARQTMAEMPVIARPVTSVLISWVPS